MPRKQNQEQELLKEREEFDVTENGELQTQTEYNETQAPESEDEVLMVNQTYLTEETLPEEVKNQPVMHHAEHEESEVEGSETEEDESEYEYEEEGELEEEGEYEYEEEGAGSPERSKMRMVLDRVMASVRDTDGKLDKAQIAKYAGIAVLAVYGLSRTSLLGKILVSGVVALLAKQLLNGPAVSHEQETEESEAAAA